ncbi:MAG: hypothetical protein JWN20_349 [Jatrophihabitantaceae bacterium]|nr:hypothetical protein [Jatrophihabitantaceae bacterium]
MSPDSLADGPEVPLLGGDVTEGLVRIGDTVRRPRLPVSDFVATVLEHLELMNFAGAPRYLGIDSKGRQALSFVPGEVAMRPSPGWAGDDATVVSVARLIRRFDDAMQTMPMTATASSAVWPDPPGAPASIADPPQFIGHRDITPGNVVFRDGEAVALIDFDSAGPTTRVQEVVNLLQWWAPLMPVSDRPASLANVDAFARTALIVEEYGLVEDERHRVVPVAINSADRTWFTMRDRSERLGGGWRRMWEHGAGDSILRRQQWLRDNAAQIHAALRLTTRR